MPIAVRIVVTATCDMCGAVKTAGGKLRQDAISELRNKHAWTIYDRNGSKVHNTRCPDCKGVQRWKWNEKRPEQFNPNQMEHVQ